MTFYDDDLKRLKEDIHKNKTRTGIRFNLHYRTEIIDALLARMELAELKDCNQFHCGHVSCNAWRKAAGK